MAEKKPKKLDWMKIKPAELEKIVLDLHKKGETPAKIGIILRDKYGVPKAKLLSKRVTRILKDAGAKVKTEKEAMQEKIDALNRHIEKNIHDQSAKRRLIKQLWALKKAK